MKIGESHRHAASPCLNCGKRLAGSFAILDDENDARPMPGDLTMCAECGHLMIFADGFSLRELTGEEMRAVAGDRRLVVASNALARAWREK